MLAWTDEAGMARATNDCWKGEAPQMSKNTSWTADLYDHDFFRAGGSFDSATAAREWAAEWHNVTHWTLTKYIGDDVSFQRTYPGPLARDPQPAAQSPAEHSLGVDNWPAGDWNEVATGRSVITGEQEYTHVRVGARDDRAEEYEQCEREHRYDYQD